MTGRKWNEGGLLSRVGRSCCDATGDFETAPWSGEDMEASLFADWIASRPEWARTMGSGGVVGHLWRRPDEEVMLALVFVLVGVPLAPTQEQEEPPRSGLLGQEQSVGSGDAPTRRWDAFERNRKAINFRSDATECHPSADRLRLWQIGADLGDHGTASQLVSEHRRSAFLPFGSVTGLCADARPRLT
ncbi:unnamed protein product [Clonostachys rosea]|uniref:Uncharacterized protein n=1 Tax=Bionectria ochroleuca TaxID=29856 RepID=A0ABY6TSC3_BIOOC|nr:unnamed protein product [Clonostachys rosea]